MCSVFHPRILAFALGFWVVNLMSASNVSTHFFKIDPKAGRILGMADGVAALPELRLLSVTVDQTQYWPHETVFLKVFFPLHPGITVRVQKTRHQGAPADEDRLVLNGAGMGVLPLMDGSKIPLETGEWKVSVKSMDGTLEAHASFAVSAGSLSPVSLAHPFAPVTRGEDFEKTPGAVFLVNGSGVGNRWGNGLHIRNELRVHGVPFQGEVQIISRCFLPGCNGAAAGEPVAVPVDKGLFRATLGVGGHSGPYGIEVITPDGSLTHVFSHTSHVERQPIPLSGYLVKNHVGTLAPYEGAKEIFGRGIYLSQQTGHPGALFSLPSLSTKNGSTIDLQASKSVRGLKILAYRPDQTGSFKPTWEPAPEVLTPGKPLRLPVESPMTLFAVGGFDGDQYSEAWFFGLTESSRELKVSTVTRDLPLSEITVSLNAWDRLTGKGIPQFGVLEVFDTRVESPNARDPLLSSLGDHVRSSADLLSTWRDTTGLLGPDRDERPKEEKMMRKSAMAVNSVGAPPPPSIPPPPGVPMASPAATRPAGPTAPSPSNPEGAPRTGEKKVVACLLVQTDVQGRSTVKVTLPPQTGRVQVRFITADLFDSASAESAVDVAQENLLETTVPAHLLPGNHVTVPLRIESKEEGLRVQVSGSAVSDPFELPVPRGGGMVPLPLRNLRSGDLDLTLRSGTGKALDLRRFPFQDPHRATVTFSKLARANGHAIVLPAGERLVVYPSPLLLLDDVVRKVDVTLQSWFSTGEAVAAQARIRSLLLRGMAELNLPSAGLETPWQLALARNLKDLRETYWDPATKRFRGYPGTDPGEAETTRIIGHLRALQETLKKAKTPALQKFSASQDSWLSSLPKPAPDVLTGEELPVKVGNEIVFRTILDPGVTPWFIENALPVIREGEATRGRAFQSLLDKFRFLRAFERTGEAHWLLLNARALHLQKHPAFDEVFDRLVANLAMVQDPGLIQGPALTGGIYASPGILIPFIELLLDMNAGQASTSAVTLESLSPKKSAETLSGLEPRILPVSSEKTEFLLTKGTFYRIDRTAAVDPWHIPEGSPSSQFQLSKAPGTLAVGQEGKLQVTLNPERDPASYVAWVLLPAHLALKLTADNLRDARGASLVGQGQTGGQKVQVARIPFRGSRDMTLILEGLYPGEGDGQIVVRHLADEKDLSSLPLQGWTVN